MTEWLLRPNSPTQIRLAADARLTPTSYTNDQTWIFSPFQGEPPGLALETTYGLRARSMRLLLRFLYRGKTVSHPSEFASPILVTAWFPNYLEMSFSPFTGIDAQLAYWVATSQSLAIRLALKNLTKKSQEIQVEWIGLLAPLEGGERMKVIEQAYVTLLTGKSGGVEPVFFLTGGAAPLQGPFPGLGQAISLKPNQTHTVTAALSSLSHQNASFEQARIIANKNWAAESARIRMTNARQLVILTGNPEWNHLFEYSQSIGAGLIVSPNEYLPNPSFVMSRQPDHGYSARGDGSDYNYLWNGQTAWQALYLIEEVLPHLTDLGIGILENFLSTQSEDGSIEWKPSLANQRSKLTASPILATLAEVIFDRTLDVEFIAKVYPALKRFNDHWFSPEHDADQDQIPEWQHVFQTGFEDNLLFSSWGEGAQGVNISILESPDLCSMLYRECLALSRIAEVIGAHPDLPTFKDRANTLRRAVEAHWLEDASRYFYWDRDNHNIYPKQILATQEGAGEFLSQQTFDQPVRLQFHLRCSQEASRRVNLFLYGVGSTGDRRIERITPDQFTWSTFNGYATSGKTYLQLDKITVEGIQDQDLLIVYTVGHDWLDHTLLLPLWAGIPSEERAAQLVKKIILDPVHFWQPYGISSYSLSNVGSEGEVHLPYNAMIMKGLVRYGYRLEAAELFTRIMNTFSQQFRREGCFRQTYHPKTGVGKGEKNALAGLIPVGTFLEIIGVRIISPWKVDITGYNPFPWPVTVKYCGTTILRKPDSTTITFPDGQSVNVEEGATQRISLED